MPSPHHPDEPTRATDAPVDDAMNALVAEALDAIDREGSSALESFCAQHPAHADALRRRVELLRAFGFEGESGKLPERLGGFRLLRKLGGGGMGVVYVAEQEGLGRQVALKLVRPELLYFAGARERFQRELEALARLQHPGIVPVFAGGTEGGLPYLAMEYVRGATLEEALQELRGQSPEKLTGRHLHAAVAACVARSRAAQRASGESGARGETSASESGSGALPALYAGSWVATCMRIALAIAEALQHAHDQGVLHRDLKPSNLMLTASGRVLLLDFGLASTAGSTKLTGTGQAIGSPLYMSPEQMRGELARIDARSDVYGLGLLLYEALTLHQPFQGTSFEDTRMKVLGANPPAPRLRNPSIPRDAETVVLVAMDRDPLRRYPSAQEFADDLRCVLELRPIRARRPGTGVRAQRWVQRHPAASVAIACTALLCIGGPLVFGWQQHQANVEIGKALVEAERQRDAAQQSSARAERAREEASRQRDIAAENFARAESAVDLLLTQVAQDELLQAPHLEPVRRKLLESALAFYEELLEQKTDDDELLEKVGYAAFRAGFLLQQLGRFEEALRAHERQLEIVQALEAKRGRDLAVLQLLGWGTGGIAACASFLGQNERALASIAECLQHLEERRRRFPGDTSVLFDLDEALGRRAHIQSFGGDPRAALETYRELVELDLEIVEIESLHNDRDRSLANALVALGNLAQTCLQLELVDEADRATQRGESLLAAHRAEILATPSGLLAAAALLEARSSLHGGRGDYAAAIASTRACIELLDLARPQRPSDIEILRLLATAWNNLALLQSRAELPAEERLASYAAAVRIGREMIEIAPAVPLYLANLARTLMNRGDQQRELGHLADAAATLEEAWRLESEAARLAPGLGDSPRLLFFCAWHLGLVYLDQRDADRAADAAQRIASVAAGDPFPLRMAAGVQARAVALTTDDAQRSSRLEEARTWLRAAVEAGYADLEQMDTAPDLELLRQQEEFAELRAIVVENERQKGNG
ncbi:MAG: serine/threonine protein kinase [Planctomycetes bacterium]|nr:serine/threonine protein kinase [Planctomycetota bacterium]